ncbi:MAG: hypothetical protein K2W82_15865 [Candidatus Obscuribacterales bacterium]|nr:hypothetical protein [Candidatus Obscuribacterales bacterium]
MTTASTAPQHDIQGLLSELANRKVAYTAVATRMDKVRRFLQDQRGALNEQQFTSNLEALAGNAAGTADLIRGQRRLRCRYQTGRAAIFCVFEQLIRQRKMFARQLTKVACTIEHVTDSAERLSLLTACVSTEKFLADSYGVAYDLYNGALKDLTAGQADDSLIQAFQELCHSGRSGQEGSEKKPSTREPEDYLWFISLHDMRFSAGPVFAHIAINEELFAIAEAVKAIVTHENYHEPWNRYVSAMVDLNEPQYTQRLQQAASNQERIKAIKQEQLGKRACFLEKRGYVESLHQQLAALKIQLLEAANRLKATVENIDRPSTWSEIAAMSNVINAYALCDWIDRHIPFWRKEMVDTHDVASFCEKSLSAALQETLSTSAFYRNHGCSYYGPGHYVEAL